MKIDLFEKFKEMFKSIKDEIYRVDKQFREPFRDLFKQYLQDLTKSEVFSEIPTSERADYTAFWGYREEEPDERLSHQKEKTSLKADLWNVHPKGNEPIKGTRVYKQGGGGSEPHDYPEGKSLELYLLEEGDLLEYEVNNQMNETPMDPSSHTTTKIYILTRKKNHCWPINSFLQKLNILESRDLLLHIIMYNENRWLKY